ncbi:hypothetical protein ACP70R_006334 [Stipagrostis hirtigluma subsp. patula]
MPTASRKLPAKRSPPAASASKPRSTAPSFLVVGDCDDDDDFVSPTPASRGGPLRPCSGNGNASSRLRKKLKLPSSSGKENRPVAGGTAPAKKVAATAPEGAETLAVGSRVSGVVPGAEGSVPGKICSISKSGSDGSKLGRNEKMVAHRYGDCNGGSSSFSNSIEFRLPVLGAACDLGDGHCQEVQAVGSTHCTSVSEEHAMAQVRKAKSDMPTMESDLSGSDALEGCYRSRLIEPMFLESDANYESRLPGSEDSKELGSGILSSAIDDKNVGKKVGVLSNCGSGGDDCNGAQEPGLRFCNLVSQERKVATTHCVPPENETMENTSSVPEAFKEHCCSTSSESKLSVSHMIHNFDGDGNDDFEIGTQLHELINLCIDGYIEGHSDCRASPIKEKTFDYNSESDSAVKCPLCGLDISDLSEELRQLHTNNCLDHEPAKECNSNNEREPCAVENVENKRVVEWIRNLGLSKYEEIFIREEVDWETLQWLTEEDLLGMGITSLGPRKKITHALGELRKKHDHANDMEADLVNSENAKKAKLPPNGNKLITEYFQCSSFEQRQRRACNVNKPSNLNEKKRSSAKIATKRSHAGKGKVKDTPLWCCIPGTPFRVDAFRYLRGDCCHWFLTHFHIDQQTFLECLYFAAADTKARTNIGGSAYVSNYQGLTRSFCHGKIYCSSITASLVHHKIGIPWDRLHVLPLNEKITISGISLTCFDANHCPGSIIILFEPPNGKAVLHTGDFRFSSAMANNTVLKSSHIHTLILDTTYCNPRYDFPSQEIVIQFVIEAIQAEAFNPKTLFLIGSYTIGKERLYMEVARLLQKKIYVGAAKLQILKHLELPPEIMHWFTANEAESHIHVVPMWMLASFKRLKHLSNQYAGRFDLIVAFCPTGWSFGKGRKRTPGKRWQQGSIIRYEVPYSEHSSFTELQEFVRFISPEHIIPSVNNDGPESADAMLSQLLNE